ncbi:MAG: hypothetical protein ACE361_05885 [Aureliella sp.]
MRTVSFSSPIVRKTLQEKFVCQLMNTTGDPSAGASIGHAPKDTPGYCTRGIGKQNVQCLFLTPRGEIFHAASGYRGPEDLQAELTFALDLYQGMHRHPSSARQLVRDAHIKRLRAQGFSDDLITRSDPGGMLMMMQSARNFADLGFADLGSRSVGNPMEAANRVFAVKTRNSELSDGRFSVHYPLIPMSKFLEDPRILVGRESSAFQSVGNGGASGGSIGLRN